jgi:3-oxoacyl-[acyl-carrier protein] reductase
LRGLGRAIALAREGVNLVINARSEAALETLADDIRRENGVGVTAIAADITSEAGRRAVLAAAPKPDILINNAGGPPPGDFRKLARILRTHGQKLRFAQ